MKNKKRNDNKLKLIKRKIILLFCLFILMIIFFLITDKLNINNDIIESMDYDNFNIMKNKHETIENYKTILDQIKIILYIRSNKVKKYKKNKTNINIIVSLNSRYTYILLVSMSTVLLNCDKKKTFITYHVLCSPSVSIKNINYLKSFMNDYYNNLEMIFYNMTTLADYRQNSLYSKAAYFRIYSPIFINSDRIIYLDGDTLTFGDLREMYNLNFNDNYILGFLDVLSNGVDYLGLRSDRYINSGVVLLNLKKILEDGIINKLIEGINNKKLILRNVDQTLLNYILYPKIGKLPCKFGILNFEGKTKLDLIYLE